MRRRATTVWVVLMDNARVSIKTGKRNKGNRSEAELAKAKPSKGKKGERKKEKDI
jgi:hypothetical protein